MPDRPDQPESRPGGTYHHAYNMFHGVPIDTDPRYFYPKVPESDGCTHDWVEVGADSGGVSTGKWWRTVWYECARCARGARTDESED